MNASITFLDHDSAQGGVVRFPDPNPSSQKRQPFLNQKDSLGVSIQAEKLPFPCKRSRDGLTMPATARRPVDIDAFGIGNEV